MRSMSADDDAVSLFATRADESFRTDSGSVAFALSLDLNDTTGRFYGYGNREMVQRDKGIWLHTA